MYTWLQTIFLAYMYYLLQTCIIFLAYYLLQNCVTAKKVTVLYKNYTTGDSDDYGLKVENTMSTDSSSSTIQLVSPLTKQQVSLDNGGGGNWGAGKGGDINQIKTISEAELEEAVESDTGSIKVLSAEKGEM